MLDNFAIYYQVHLTYSIFYYKVTSGVANSKLKQWLLQTALNSKENDLKR